MFKEIKTGIKNMNKRFYQSPSRFLKGPNKLWEIINIITRLNKVNKTPRVVSKEITLWIAVI